MLQVSVQPASEPGVLRKICKTCGEPKLLTDFYADTRATDQVYTVCKSCHNGVAHTSRRGIYSRPDLGIRWTRAMYAVKLSMACKHCGGIGVMTSPYYAANPNQKVPCYCLIRAVWSSLLSDYRHACEAAGTGYAVTSHHGQHGIVYSRKGEEFIADFELLLRRSAEQLDNTGEFKFHSRIWKLHYVEELKWSVIARKLGLVPDEYNRLRLKKAIERLESAAVVRAVTLEPYGLFPLSDYMFVSQDKSGRDYTLTTPFEGHPKNAKARPLV